MPAIQSGKEPAFAIPKPCCTLAITGTEQAQLIQMFKAISNETRFEILKFLITHPGCITADLVDFLPIAQATVSQHLKVLRAAGWIAICGRQGPATHYCLNNDRITWFKGQVGEIF
ncbi:MAG: winged helix-turn-helix transcriptional regulator [Anaerolineales bacterium]|nr:winged helix-turn-helix transcriptional regulator [Anaerolineales bacterium]MCB8962301.1 winged helix-turn-helix transcriptional regulator [Ardenticatenales bacterium]